MWETNYCAELTPNLSLHYKYILNLILLSVIHKRRLDNMFIEWFIISLIKSLVGRDQNRNVVGWGLSSP